jgi:catechol 2,3-dioxygenase-like lactoylglutathione lyase family enzyme
MMAFLSTADPKLARDFYENTLGLKFIGDEPFAVVFDLHGIMLRIAKVREVTTVPGTVLGWKVPDINAAVTDLAARGIRFQRYGGMTQDEFGIWTSPSGARVAWFQDPDGNTLSLTEFPK